MSNKRLTWEEIKAQYNQEWVELVEYDWPEEDLYPKAGIVRVHAHSRKDFDQLAAKDAPIDSAYIYVGRRELARSSFLNTFRVLEIR